MLRNEEALHNIIIAFSKNKETHKISNAALSYLVRRKCEARILTIFEMPSIKYLTYTSSKQIVFKMAFLTTSEMS